MTHTFKQVKPTYNLWHINPFKPQFTIVIFIHYKPRIDVAILNF